jgi:hypothetical protein
VGFEPAIPESEWPQIRAASGIGRYKIFGHKYKLQNGSHLSTFTKKQACFNTGDKRAKLFPATDNSAT